MSVKELTSQNFDEVIKSADKPVLVDFWASWCGPCKMLAPIIHELADENGDTVLVCSVNVDDEPQLASRFDVMSIPTVISFKNGNIHDKTVGVHSKDELLELI